MKKFGNLSKIKQAVDKFKPKIGSAGKLTQQSSIGSKLKQQSSIQPKASTFGQLSSLVKSKSRGRKKA
jgi:hypothetical protein